MINVNQYNKPLKFLLNLFLKVLNQKINEYAEKCEFLRRINQNNEFYMKTLEEKISSTDRERKILSNHISRCENGDSFNQKGNFKIETSQKNRQIHLLNNLNLLMQTKLLVGS